MEEEVKLTTKDNFIIYGTWNYLQKSATLLIFVHGLSGNQYEHHYFNAVPFFTSEGFDTFRFDFYSRKPDARILSESSVTSHVQDLELIIDHFKDKYDKLILIGHSLGALTILKTDLSNISKIVIWDPTMGYKKLEDKNASFNDKLDKYILRWGMEIIVSKQLMEEWKEASNPQKLVENINKPCKFIFAEFGSFEHWKPSLNLINVKNESVVIKGATHCYYEEGTEQKLFDETLKWIV